MSSDGFARHTPVLSSSRILRVVSIDATLISHVSETITKLSDPTQWLEIGDPVQDIVDECDLTVHKWYSDMLIGSIFPFMSALPAGWLSLDGSTYDEDDYPELYAKLDSFFVDDIAKTFTLPDLAGRFIIQDDGVMGIGNEGGAETVTLTVDEIPAHTHTYVPPVADIDLELAGAPDVFAARLGVSSPTGSTGGGQAHDNLPPYLALNYGVFAGRE